MIIRYGSSVIGRITSAVPYKQALQPSPALHITYRDSIYPLPMEVYLDAVLARGDLDELLAHNLHNELQAEAMMTTIDISEPVRCLPTVFQISGSMIIDTKPK